ncbi:putative acetyltransferase [Radiomyces spectabilis]|uniref:putative acetyltransferase n=1 Tax=Radiomyces spectabilis TaxID=64574 RepID=UPI0022207417|nr:putative acetyltransferase [Radiomyces spectabilis]KAI8388039.1 putative acetyltransferase [Radiomyces spectabilis]
MSVSIAPFNKREDNLAELTSLIQQLSTSATISSVQRAVESAHCYVLIARDESTRKMVGSATMAQMECPTGIRAHIEDVIVDVNWRGKGIAKRLLEEAIRFAKYQNAKTIDLTSRPEREAANRLYQKVGFVKRDTNVYRFQDQ